MWPDLREIVRWLCQIFSRAPPALVSLLMPLSKASLLEGSKEEVAKCPGQGRLSQYLQILQLA